MRYAKIEIKKLPDRNIANRRLVHDGHVMINEKDISGMLTGSFEDAVESLGGTVLTSHEAKVELSKNTYKWHNK